MIIKGFDFDKQGSFEYDNIKERDEFHAKDYYQIILKQKGHNSNNCDWFVEEGGNALLKEKELLNHSLQDQPKNQTGESLNVNHKAIQSLISEKQKNEVLNKELADSYLDKAEADVKIVKLIEANSFMDDLKQARQDLSGALQESLDREAELRKEIRTLKKENPDDTLFEDYTEIREMITGEGSVYTMTHGEFLEVISDMLQRDSDMRKKVEKLTDTTENTLHTNREKSMSMVKKINIVSNRNGTWSYGRALDRYGHDMTDNHTGEEITVDEEITKNDKTIAAFMFSQLYSGAAFNRVSSDDKDRARDKEAFKHVEDLFSNYDQAIDWIFNSKDRLLPEGSLEALYKALSSSDENGNYDTDLLSDMATRFSHGNGVPPSQFVALELSILATLLPNPNQLASNNAPILLKELNNMSPEDVPLSEKPCFKAAEYQSSYSPSEALINTLEGHNLIDKFEAFLDNPLDTIKNISTEQYVAPTNLGIK